jgi:hypothetical protein
MEFVSGGVRENGKEGGAMDLMNGLPNFWYVSFESLRKNEIKTFQQKEIKYEFAEDGTFWMELSDFCKQFNELYILRLYHDSVGKVWNRFLTKVILIQCLLRIIEPFLLQQSKWEDQNDGGCANNRETWFHNPQYRINCFGSKNRIFLSLSQRDQRYSGSLPFVPFSWTYTHFS